MQLDTHFSLLQMPGISGTVLYCTVLLEVQHPHCVSHNHKIKQQTPESQKHNYKKMAEGCTIYHCILYSPQPFSLNVQPDEGLLEAETCSWLAVTIVRCIYFYIYNIV